jgi:hypothetical protein
LHQKYLARIRTRVFKPLGPEDEGDAAVGWVPIERPFDEDISFRSDGIFFGSYVNLALRIDQWKFPTALVKQRMAAAERDYKVKTGKERISRAEKAELRDFVERKLRKNGVPTTKAVDFTWNTASSELRFFGRSTKLLEHFHEIFEKTFAMRLVPAAPYTIGLEAKLPRALQIALAEVEPLPMHVTDMGEVA